jgi:hypothetical protein
MLTHRSSPIAGRLVEGVFDGFATTPDFLAPVVLVEHLTTHVKPEPIDALTAEYLYAGVFVDLMDEWKLFPNCPAQIPDIFHLCAHHIRNASGIQTHDECSLGMVHAFET